MKMAIVSQSNTQTKPRGKANTAALCMNARDVQCVGETVGTVDYLLL